MSTPDDEDAEELLTMDIPSTLMRKLEKEVPSQELSAFVAKALQFALDKEERSAG